MDAMTKVGLGQFGILDVPVMFWSALFRFVSTVPDELPPVRLKV